MEGGPFIVLSHLLWKLNPCRSSSLAFLEISDLVDSKVSFLLKVIYILILITINRVHEDQEDDLANLAKLEYL